LQLILNIPGSPQGEELEVPGLGLFANGGTYDISEEQLEIAAGHGFVYKTDPIVIPLPTAEAVVSQRPVGLVAAPLVALIAANQKEGE
jgi:hypothetical protein